jgi:hypothetical protein
MPIIGENFIEAADSVLVASAPLETDPIGAKAPRSYVRLHVQPPTPLTLSAMYCIHHPGSLLVHQIEIPHHDRYLSDSFDKIAKVIKLV